MNKPVAIQANCYLLVDAAFSDGLFGAIASVQVGPFTWDTVDVYYAFVALIAGIYLVQKSGKELIAEAKNYDERGEMANRMAAEACLHAVAYSHTCSSTLSDCSFDHHSDRQRSASVPTGERR